MVALSVSSHSLRARLLGCSLAALAAGIAGAARADCLPDPPVFNGATHCSGTTTGEVTALGGANVTVDAGATLNAATGDGAAFTASSLAPTIYAQPSTLVVNGHVAGGTSAAGVRLTNGFDATWYYYPSPTVLNMTVGADGVIDGATGILLQRNQAGVNTNVTATLDNSGAIRSSSGPAIASSDMSNEGFSSITNRGGGFIGGIRASVGALTNAGTIDGGTGSAYAVSAPYGLIYPYSVLNSGLIGSNGVDATMALGLGSLTVNNSGQIVNSGSGLAIDATQNLSVSNETGATIGSGGSIAIRTAGAITLTNRGTINGSVISLSSASNAASTIDTLGGHINGDVLLGAGDDTLTGTLDVATGKIAEVSGRIDGGGGLNTLRFTVNQSAVLDGVGANLPTHFQAFQIGLTQGAIVTFNNDTPDGLSISGDGGLITNGKVTSNGSAFVSGPYYYSSNPGLNFTNNGEITSTFDPVAYPDPSSSGYAVSLSFINSANNSGKIIAVGGGGLAVSFNYGAPGLVNTGSIIADGAALNVSGGPFVNSGVIRSNAGRGVYVSLGGGTVRAVTSTNNGAIEGVTNGVVLSSVTFANAGTVAASNGVAVNPGWYSAFDNLAGGVITGSKAAVSFEGYGYNAIISNAGVINGDVDLTTATVDSGDVFYDKGGTLNGNLLLGGGDDVLVSDLSRLKDGKFTWISGRLDAGAGNDLLVLGVSQDGAMALDAPLGFESVSFDLKNDAKLTLTATQSVTSMLSLSGKGSVDLSANLDITDVYGIYVGAPYGQWNAVSDPLSIISRGALSFKASSQYSGYGALVRLNETTSFENAGSVTVVSAANAGSQEVAILGGKSVTNSGQIVLDGAIGVSGAGSLTNSGTIRQATNGAAAIGVNNVATIVNSGAIQTQGQAIGYNGYSYLPISIQNSGTISSTGANAIQSDYASLALANTTNGVVSSANGYAVHTGYGDDKISNDGAITGRVDLGGGADAIENHGTITGDITQGYGDGIVDNYGVIVGDVSLGDGNDTFILHTGASVTGVVDGGYGLDTLTLDSTNGGSVSSGQFTNFETFRQIGGGSLTYSGAFAGGPIGIDGGAAVVLAGTNVSTSTSVTFSGGAQSERITVDGSISGGVSLGDGVDTVINHGAIGGSVLLGSGDDVYTEGQGSTVSGAIDGGLGTDTYIAELNGDRTGLHSRDGFENLGVTGSGLLTLQLDQNWNAISLQGASLDLTAGGLTVGHVSGGDAAETLRLDIDVAQVDLGGGDDRLTLVGDHFAGTFAGGAGSDALQFATNAPVTITGAVSGFETIGLTGGQLLVAGTLGAAGDSTSLGDGDQTVSILAGGALVGTVDLGAGSDTFRLAAGGQLIGTVLGGAGDDLAAIDLTSDLSLRGDQLQQFETLQVTGTGALSFTGGAAKFDHVITASRDLTLATGSSLAAGTLQLDGAANTVTLAGAFTGQLDLGAGDDVLRITTGGALTGSVNGGVGLDRLELALGGTDTAPIALGASPFTGFETLSLQSGVVSVAGDYGFDLIQVSNGRLIGLAGSHLSAADITVVQGATFGSAGTVTGNIAVAGTLSPGASPGTMTVAGDVSLAAGSTALFEITPTVSDKLVVSGQVTIAQGSTLKLVGASTLTPGRTLDLIVADGGIAGSFSTIDGAQGLNLHIKQSANRLQALGLFTTDTAFSSQVSGVIATLNTALVSDKVGAALIAAMPALVDTTTGKTDPKALTRLTPQAYASASQLATEDGLSVVDAAREQSRFAPDTRGLFGFGQAITSRRTLDGDAAVGVAKGKIASTGGLGGVGYGVKSAWVGAFVGYLDGRQRIGDLDARTSANSVVVGAMGQVRLGRLELGATAAHDSLDADTTRTAPGGTAASGGYKLKSWVADVNLAYRFKLNADWTVRPRLGASYIHATRDGLVERGGGAFALTVASDKSSDWFVDGQVEVLGGQAAGERLHPYASLGFRTRAGGDDALASGLLNGLSQPLTVTGLNRDGTLASVGAGASYDLSHGLTVSATYAGEFGDGGGQAALLGLRWAF